MVPWPESNQAPCGPGFLSRARLPVPPAGRVSSLPWACVILPSWALDSRIKRTAGFVREQRHAPRFEMLSLLNVAVTYPNGVVALRPTTALFRAGNSSCSSAPPARASRRCCAASTAWCGRRRARFASKGADRFSPAARVARASAPHRHGVPAAPADRPAEGARQRAHRPARLPFRLAHLVPVLPRAEKRLALAALERVGLLDNALRRADELSGGQQQRVGIARALVQQPAIMLADEPVASLDPATADRVLALLHGICRRMASRRSSACIRSNSPAASPIGSSAWPAARSSSTGRPAKLGRSADRSASTRRNSRR